MHKINGTVTSGRRSVARLDFPLLWLGLRENRSTALIGPVQCFTIRHHPVAPAYHPQNSATLYVHDALLVRHRQTLLYRFCPDAHKDWMFFHWE